MSDDTVRVAVRIRPLVHTEKERGCQTCIAVVPGEPQIQIYSSGKSFTFNHVFGSEVDQETFYKTAIKNMVDRIFKGYNVTILAYGQTGSGKTHTMGTNYHGEESIGVIPRAIHDIFEMTHSKTDWEFKITVSFMELYQEQLFDLLSPKQRNERIVDIREDGKGIKIAGLTERPVTTTEETLKCLTSGSLGRATGATAMNAESSRSHAIFTLTINQRKLDDPNSATTSKFHLVDLAGSERSKKTQATGERFKEGVNINKGLLALGNVISQLGEANSSTYIGYRDSKLTRLLQDSLGGNSMTLMIACVSPADYNLDETLSTLRYADRARKIKNKPIVNQDPKAAEINRLNGLVQELRLALIGQGISTPFPSEEVESLIEKNRSLKKKLRELTGKLNNNLIEIVNMHERAELAEAAREKIQSAMGKILDEFLQVLLKFDKASEERAIIEPIYNKILDLQNDQKKTAHEILQHELTSMSSMNKTNNDDDENMENRVSRNVGPGSESNDQIEADSDADVDDARNNLDEKHAEHTLRQAERNHEVQNINHELALKEELVSTLVKNSSQFAEHAKELQNMENEIKSLQAEKEELMQALQNVHNNTATAKLAQTRRKKVQELEKKISELTRKCTEQMRIIKINEKSQQRIQNLSSEINSLKQARVKLIREMRKEADKFNEWKRVSEREIYKLKNQDRKRQFEMAQLRTRHDKQESVLKRKMEQVNAINKRLKDALELQQKSHQRRDKHTSDKAHEIQNWVQQEWTVLVSTVDAECSLQKLMSDRADLTNQLEKLRASAQETPEMKKRIFELQEYLDLRNAQIAELQQQIMESDQENRSNTRWQALHSMSDAKLALKALFETMAIDRKAVYAKTQDMDDMLEKYDEVRTKLRQYELREKAQAVKDTCGQMGRTNNRSTDANELKELRDELEMYKEKCLRLEEQVSITEDNNVVTDCKRLKVKGVPRRRQLSETAYHPSYHITDASSSDDDVNKDPDWKKTPLYRRIHKVMNLTKNISGEMQLPSKRSSDGDIKCACKTNCSTRLCSCRKNGALCTNCNCIAQLCQNKDKENINRDLFADFSSGGTANLHEEPTKRTRLDT